MDRRKSLFWVALIFLALAPTVTPAYPKQVDKDKHTVRMSELLISATSIEYADSLNRTDPPHRIFSVYLSVQNVGTQFPCTNLKAYLIVDPYFEYPASFIAEGQLSTHELLPKETTEGRYSFDIREGVSPKNLVLIAEDSREARCTEHPDWGSIWHYRTDARIPIEGLPMRTATGEAKVSPLAEPKAPPALKTAWSATAVAAQKRETHQQAGSSISMDDNFEYRIVDYGVGVIQIRPKMSDDNALSQPIFWIEFRVSNIADHLLGVPRYSPAESAGLVIKDNWGNDYSARSPLVQAVWSGATLPIPPRKFGRYKPQEATLDLVVVSLDEFVKDISELRVYLNRYPGDRNWHFFSVRDPMARKRNLFVGQTEPLSGELQIEIGEEVQPPILPR